MTTAPSTSMPSPIVQGRSVLLCDDEIHILRAAEFKLKRAGFDVRIAGDGLDGWTEIERLKPDLVITDCQMPRLDGFGLVRRIREQQQTADLPVIMLTAKGFELNANDLAAQWQVRALVGKPFSPRELLRLVESILDPPHAGLSAAHAFGLVEAQRVVAPLSPCL